MDRYIIVTGASRGIGKAIALEFAKKGNNIIILSMKSEYDLNNVYEEILSYGVKCLKFTTDISDYKSIENLNFEICKKNIFVEGIVNNAGICYYGLIQDMDISDWNNIISTNLSSVFYMCKTFLDNMIKNGGGKILNISSVWGNVGASCEVAYSASKGGVNAFTKALAKEVAPSNIQVNAIACGAIDTSMNSHLNSDELKMLEDEIPYGRMGTVEEVANLAYNIYSSSNYLTGQIITFDGSWT